MDVIWFKNSVSTIAAVCALVAVVECAAGENDGGLRLLCGAMAASAVIQFAAECYARLFR